MNRSTEQQIRDLNDEYVRSALEGDVAWYREHLADEFVCIDSDGSVLDKVDFLTQTAQAPELATYVLEEVDLRFYGDVALIRCTGAWTAKDGRPGTSRYIDIWVRSGADWRCVSAQITRPD